MAKITALRTAGGRRQRVRIYLDGRFAFSISAGTAARAGLRQDQTLDQDRVDSLLGKDRYTRCLDAATRYLAYRPRSLAELQSRLTRRGFDEETQQSVLARLKEQGLVDDAVFARYWADNRESFSPRSQRLTRLELQKKGVASEVVDSIVGSIDDAESAYRAASTRLNSLRRLDETVFRRRLGDYLKRRGFGYEVVASTVNRLWREVESGEDSPGGCLTVSPPDSERD